MGVRIKNNNEGVGKCKINTSLRISASGKVWKYLFWCHYFNKSQCGSPCFAVTILIAFQQTLGVRVRELSVAFQEHCICSHFDHGEETKYNRYGHLKAPVYQQDWHNSYRCNSPAIFAQFNNEIKHIGTEILQRRH